jgi:hypothetical protein
LPAERVGFAIGHLTADDGGGAGVGAVSDERPDRGDDGHGFPGEPPRFDEDQPGLLGFGEGNNPVT